MKSIPGFVGWQVDLLETGFGCSFNRFFECQDSQILAIPFQQNGEFWLADWFGIGPTINPYLTLPGLYVYL